MIEAQNKKMKNVQNKVINSNTGINNNNKKKYDI